MEFNYSQESHGIFSTSLYDAAHSRAVVRNIRKLRFTTAQVQLETADGGHQILTSRKTRAAGILTTNGTARLFGNIDKKIDRVIKPLINQIWAIDLREHAGTQIIRYRTGGHYVAHTDAGLDLAERYFTVLCYLNDDFEGGCTSFPSLGYAARPKAGKAIIFPSRFLHCAEPVLRGEKYVLITWLCGTIPIRWI